MPKLKTDSIKKDDLVEYLDSCSDFSFELSVLKMLRESDVDCEHGGWRCCINISNLLINNNFSKICKNYN